MRFRFYLRNTLAMAREKGTGNHGGKNIFPNVSQTRESRAIISSGKKYLNKAN